MLLSSATQAISAHTGLEEKEISPLLEVPPQPEWGGCSVSLFFAG